MQQTSRLTDACSPLLFISSGSWTLFSVTTLSNQSTLPLAMGKARTRGRKAPILLAFQHGGGEAAIIPGAGVTLPIR